MFSKWVSPYINTCKGFLLSHCFCFAILGSEISNPLLVTKSKAGLQKTATHWHVICPNLAAQVRQYPVFHSHFLLWIVKFCVCFCFTCYPQGFFVLHKVSHFAKRKGFPFMPDDYVCMHFTRDLRCHGWGLEWGWRLVHSRSLKINVTKKPWG